MEQPRMVGVEEEEVEEERLTQDLYSLLEEPLLLALLCLPTCHIARSQGS